jgi:hypothetical protein
MLTRQSNIAYRAGDAIRATDLATAAQHQPDRTDRKILAPANQQQARGWAIAGDYDRCAASLNRAADLSQRRGPRARPAGPGLHPPLRAGHPRRPSRNLLPRPRPHRPSHRHLPTQTRRTPRRLRPRVPASQTRRRLQPHQPDPQRSSHRPASTDPRPPDRICPHRDRTAPTSHHVDHLAHSTRCRHLYRRPGHIEPGDGYSRRGNPARYAEHRPRKRID